MILPLLLTLASTVVDGPCQEIAATVAADAVHADDNTLREAASLAESAGDYDQAARLLKQLRERSRDEAIRAEAADAESSITPDLKRAPCVTSSRRVVVAMDNALFLAPSERNRLASIVIAELNSRDIEGVFDPPASLIACELKNRCIREHLHDLEAGAYLRLQPTRVGPVVTVAIDVVGVGGNAVHNLQLDADVNRWSPVLTKPILDDIDAILPHARRRSQREIEREQAGEFDADPVIAGVTLTTLGVVVGGAGTALVVDPDLVGPNNEEQRSLVRNVGIAGIVTGSAIVLGGLVAVALIMDAHDDN